MKKKYIIIIGLTVLIILLIFVSFYKNNSTNTIDKSTKPSGSMTKDNYYVETGIEDPAKVARLAIEAYATQDNAESVESRGGRLAKYFTNDSPAYKYELDNIDSSTNKSTAVVTSVTSCEEQEGGDWCLIVMADKKLYSKNNSTPITSTYWITLKQQDDKTYKAYDVGLW